MSDKLKEKESKWNVINKILEDLGITEVNWTKGRGQGERR